MGALAGPGPGGTTSDRNWTRQGPRQRRRRPCEILSETLMDGWTCALLLLLLLRTISSLGHVVAAMFSRDAAAVNHRETKRYVGYGVVRYEVDINPRTVTVRSMLNSRNVLFLDVV